VAATTWGTLALEFALAVGLFLPKRRWRPLLLGGLLLHGAIAMLMGLPSFSLAMFAALILFLRPWESPFAIPTPVKFRSGAPRVRTPISARTANEITAGTTSDERADVAPVVRTPQPASSP
jgi:hypothetical protein